MRDDAGRDQQSSTSVDLCLCQRFLPRSGGTPPSNRRIDCPNGDTIVATGILTMRHGHVYHPLLAPIWNNTVGLNHGRGSEMICIDGYPSRGLCGQTECRQRAIGII